MKRRKIISVLIIIITILNIFVPNVALAVNEVDSKENNKINKEEIKHDNEENVNKNNTENILENDKIEKETIEENNFNTIETNDIKEKEEKNTINEQMIREDVKTVETKYMIYVETPNNGDTYYSNEISSINVTGWKMANVANTYIKAYINGKEISEEIKYVDRTDVTGTIEGYGTAEQNKNAGYSFGIDTSNLKSGENIVKIELYEGSKKIGETSISIRYETGMHIKYRSYVEMYGWKDWKRDGELSGTEGESLRLEAINIEIENGTEKDLGVRYQVHIQDKGWQEWQENGEMAGTSGECLRLEAIKIELQNTENYSIMYRVHIQDKGWQEWKTDGEMAGTSGECLRLEAIEIKIVEKQRKAMIYVETPNNGDTYYSNEISSINVTGWKMANVANTYIKAYINGKEIVEEIKYVNRPDVTGTIEGYGTVEQNKNAGYSFGIDASDLKSGENIVKIELYEDSKKIGETNISIRYETGMHIKYKTHVEMYGWQNWKRDGELSGTEGESLRLEAINIEIENGAEKDLGVRYQVHIQDKGWQEWQENGEMAGTSGEELRLEAIKIELQNTENYSIMYRVHIQDKGWQEWKTDGEMAGTSGECLRLEAIEIKIVEKQRKAMIYVETPNNGDTYYSNEISSINVTGWKMANVANTYIKAYIDGKEIAEEITYVDRPDVIGTMTGYGTEEQNPMPGFNFNINVSDLQVGNHTLKVEMLDKNNVLVIMEKTFYLDGNPHIEYKAHIEQLGWQDYVRDGEIIGTTGKSYRIEALNINLVNAKEPAHIKYKAYIEGKGWTDYEQDGTQIGTTGESKKIEGLQIELEGLDGYVVEYQAYVQNIGWQAWATNGMTVGDLESDYRIEALKIRLVKEENSIVPQIKYSIHNQENNWISNEKNGSILGNETTEINALKISLDNIKGANIRYQVHARNIGWIAEVKNNEQAGTGAINNGIEAVRIKLEGVNGYSVEYRTFVSGKGWQEWVRDGEVSGTTGEDLRISAIQVRIVVRGGINNSSNFLELNETDYPGYKQALEALQSQHPNWIINIDYTGLDWNTVLNNEDVLITGKNGAVSARSLTQYTDQWRSGDPTQYEKGWYRASRAAIAYMMDPRNSLDDEYVFQFQELASSQGTYSEIATMIDGTFLTKYSGVSNTDSVINSILNSAQMYNISPYHLVSRMLQEQGRDGGSLNGYSYGGRTVYNLFNIGASNSATASSIENGAAYAYNHHWFTPETCIKGSAEFLARDYISIGQSTLYYQKYDVVGDELYTHQYMTNIRAANDEGQRIGKDYKENGLIDLPLEFTIPVYENMPTDPSPRPNGTMP